MADTPEMCTYVTFELGFQSRDIIIRNCIEARHKRSKTFRCSWVIRRRDSRKGASPKVILGKDNLGLIRGNAFNVISPTPRKFDRRFSTFDTRVHWQDAVVTKVLGNVFRVFTKSIVMKGATGEGEFVCLVHQGFDDFRVTMSLIYRRIRRKELSLLWKGS